MTERDKRWEALVEQAYKEGADAGASFEPLTNGHDPFDLGDGWKKSTARKMAKAIAKEAL